MQPGPRLANEIGHNLLVGALAGFVQWHLVLRVRGVAARDWVPVMAVAMPADAAPFGLLVLGLVTAWGWQRLGLTATPPVM